MTTEGLSRLIKTERPALDLHRAAVEAAPEGVVVVAEAEGVVVAFNAAAADLFGRPRDAVIGLPVESLLATPEDGPAGFLGPAATDASGNPQGRHFVACLRGDGGTVTIEVSVGRVDVGGQGFFVAIVRDMKLALGETWDEDEARLGSIAANLPGIVFQRVLQADGTIYYPFFSSGVRDVLGIEPEALRVNHHGCLDVIHWADREDHLKAVHASAQDFSPINEEFRAITGDGEVRWLRGMSRPQRMPMGGVIWDGVLIDVTERKHAEQRLEMVMNHAYDSIVTINEQGAMLSVNAAVESLFGYQAAELVGQNVAMLMPEGYARGHQSHIDCYVATGESRILGIGPVEVQGRRKDGGHFALELALSEVRAEGRRFFIGVMRDITARKNTEAALRESQQRLSSIAANIPGMVFQRLLKPDGRIEFTFVSDGCRDILGVSPEEMIADPNLFLDALSPRDREQFLDGLQASADSLEPIEDEVRLVGANNGDRWLRGWSKPRRLDNGDVVWDGVMLDVTDRKQAEERLLFLAYYDPVTKVGNRALFLDRFERARAFADRLDTSLAVLSVGIDRFTIINASMGHTVGDKVLETVANRLRLSTEAGDLVARSSGDRFLVILTGIISDEVLAESLDAIQAAFGEPILIDCQEFDVTVSIGASLYPRHGADAESLIKGAETALHRAKAQGPGSMQVFTAEMSALAARTLSTQNRLRHALENKEFVAYYQPQIAMDTGAVVGMEALVRWLDPERGLVPPGEFIAAAEESGFIDGICDQVLRYACNSLRTWREEGVPLVPVAVNVSGRQFQNARHLLVTLEQVLMETAVDPSLLEIELTESSAMNDPDNAIAVVKTLRDRGISCAIDDFGTGYSSLGVLKRFPITKLKIDRSFVQDVISDSNDAAIVSAIIAMSHALKMDVIAEGVEEMPHFEFLKALGCDQIQGYLVSRPIPHEAMTTFLREWRWQPLVAG